MQDAAIDGRQRLAGAVERHRNKLFAVVAVVMAYALLGFLVAPLLVKKAAVESVRETLNTDLRINSVAINPFVLSLRADGLELDDPAGEPFARIDEIFVNFQLSSLFRRAWTFDELHIASPWLNLARDGQGAVNVARLAMPKGDAAEAEPPAGGSNGLPRLIVFAFAMTNGVVQWKDAVPPEPVETAFGPVSIAISELNTLPEREGDQAVVIRTGTAGTLSWSGSLQLNPLKSAGRAEIRGSHFPLASAYVRHDVGFDVVEGDADVDLDYMVETQADGTIRATVDNLALTFRDVLVRTFMPSLVNGANGAAAGAREVLRLPALRLVGGSLRWPEQTVSIEAIDIDDAVVSLLRDETGALDVVRRPGPEADESPAPADSGKTQRARPAPASGNSTRLWNLSLGRFAINRMAVDIEDRSVEPHAHLGIRNLELAAADISNAEGAAFPTTLALEFRHGGTASLDGDIIALPEPLLELDVDVEGASLAAIQSYIEALADVSVDSGALNVDGTLSHSPEEPLSFRGDVEVVDFLITETDTGSQLGSWASVLADNVDFSAAGSSVEISEIVMREPYGDILITEDGSVNLGRAIKAEGGETTAPPEPETDAEKPPEEALSVAIGRVVIENGAADFADQSLPLPFSAAIAALNGNLTTIATASSEPSTVALEGKVDEFGLVRISGNVTPLDPKRDTDLEVVFRNVEMPKFSAYSIPLAGREIASGRLDLDLGYKLVTSVLEGENNIVLRDFELGDEVEHPDAMSLPLGLAVALLKDPDGMIDIDLPVRGNVDDPEFRYGGLVWKALTNLVVKIVASPFALLANLVGAESSDLENVTFLAGRSDLTPPEQEKIAKLAEAMTLRPQLMLEIPGVLDRKADALAIRTGKLDALIEQRIAGSKVTGDSDNDQQVMYAEQRREVMEALYAELAGAEDPDVALEQLKIDYTTLEPGSEDEEPQERFDAPAYASELHRRLIELQPLTDAELAALARERAGTARTAIVTVNPELDGRLRLTELQEVSGDGDNIEMKVALTAGSQ